MLRPGAERVERLGGLHRFMNWDGPILTDSGGFQVMSLAELRHLSEEGGDVPLAHRRIEARPEPRDVDGDPADAGLGHRDGLRRVPRAAGGPDADRGVDAALDALGGALEGRVRGPAGGTRCSASSRGGSTEELRAESADALRTIGFDGYAVGGLAVGEGQAAMFGVLDYAPAQLPSGRPRYLMGGGQARGHRRRGGAGDRYDGLRAAVRGRAARGRRGRGGGRSTFATRGTQTTRGRWTRRAGARPAGGTRVPTSTMSCARRRSSDRCS